MKMRKTQAIVFDFDGTLVDASEAICHAFNLALQRCNLPQMSPQDIRAMIGRPLVSMFKDVVKGDCSVDIDNLIREYQQTFFSQSLPLTRLMPGTLETLAHFSPTVKLGIATSRRSDGAVRILDRFGLLRYFSAVVGIEHVEDSKPDPEPIHRTLQQLQVPADRAVMVGDTIDDMIAGKRAGLTTVGVTTGAHSRAELINAGADHVLTELLALVDLI
ncbi:HAD family hydrolase [Acidobacteria bacterium AH-259-D05]|nr:HAD family hydrolase [Acidobacteria bacterium AH-259-D05]